MKNENVIEVNNVSKVFSKNFRSARVQLFTILKESFLGCHDKQALLQDEFWALKNISFDIKENEKLAILGPNGSGKSTLLKMINGIYLPNEGQISVNGTISSVLELSSGFKPELSGHENIYLKFALLGKKKDEVDAIIDEVIDFSELRDFMETPLKHYSSGMKSKLGFAIVTSIEPEILILDEVFAAGDNNFKLKSKARIAELYQNTTTILVTHNMNIVKDIADRVIVLKEGKLVFDGNPEEGIIFYENMYSDSNTYISAYIKKLYHDILGRKADKEGLNYWVRNLRSQSMFGSDIAVAFILSSEFSKKNTNNITFISILYQAFYNRVPSSEELNLWSARLDNGIMREDILARFLNSDEFFNLCKSYGIIAKR